MRTPTDAVARGRALLLATVVLLAAALLRAQDLHLMFDMAHYDEAYYAVDALSLIEQPRLTPFFPENFGRESLWMYALAPLLAVFGAGAFALRLAAVLTALLTVAAVYRLGCDLFGARVGLWSAAALAVLFWADVAGHQAFRAHLYPAVGALAFAALWRAWRGGRRADWLAAGVWFGVLAYTYIGARAWIGLGLLTALAALVRAWRVGRRSVQSPLQAIGLAAAISAPLWGYLIASPALAGQRTEQVAIGSPIALIENAVAWARALVIGGSSDVAYNLPGRPILDLPLALLLLGNLIPRPPLPDTGRVRRNEAEATLLIVILAGAALAPALLTVDTLKPLRAVGLIVPLALMIGLGAARLAGRGRWGGLAAALLIAWAGLNTTRDFAAWVRSPDLFLPMEQHLYRGIETLRQTAPPDAPVYVSPFSPDHPVLRLRQWRLAPRPVGAFEAADCLRLSDAPHAHYFALTLFDRDFAARFEPLARVEVVYTEPDAARYTIYRIESAAALSEGITFGERLAVDLHAPPAQAAPGEALSLIALLRRRQPLDRAYTLFVHLYGDPTPYEGGPLWAQTDAPICRSSSPPTWRADETIILPATLLLPPDLPPGAYALAIGIYETASGQRLPVSAPERGLDYAIMQAITVRPPA